MRNNPEDDFTDLLFDPNAKIEIDVDFGLLPQEAIKTHPRDNYVANPGETVFRLEGYIFSRMMRVLAVSAGASSLRYCHIKVSPSTIYASTYNHAFFGHYEAPIFQEPANVDGEIAFAISFESLKRAAAANGPVFRFVLRAEGQLIVTTEGFERTIQVVDSTKFVARFVKQREEVAEKPIALNANALVEAFRFVSTFIETETKQDHPVAQLQNGELWTRASKTIAVARISAPTDLAVSIKVEHLRGAIIALNEFRIGETVWLGFDAGYTVLKNCTYTLGFEASSASLQGIPVRPPDAESIVRIPASSLARALRPLRLTDDATNPTTSLKMTERGSKVSFDLVTSNNERERTRIRIHGTLVRGSTADKWAIPTDPLSRAIPFYKAANIELNRATVKDQALSWIDFDDELVEGADPKRISRRLYISPLTRKHVPTNSRPKLK